MGCWAIRLSCKSKPPIDTKNTCRFAPKLERAAIKRATTLSWSANELPAVNGVVNVTPLRALLICDSAPIERVVTLLYSFSSVCTRFCCSNEVMAVLTAAELYTLFLTLLIGTAPLVLTWYDSALSPAKNTALPVTLMQVKSELALPDSAKSPTLPPQPMVEPSGDDDCQIDC